MKKIEQVCETAFRLARGVQCEVLAFRRDSSLTRFADNVISQNVAASRASYTLRFLDGGRTASVTLNQDGAADLERAVKSGLEILRRQKKDPHLAPLLKPAPLPRGRNLWFEATAAMTPLYRAEKVGALARACRRAGQTACGTFESGSSEMVVANSLGVFARHVETSALYSVTVQDRDGYGWAELPVWDADGLPFERINEKARGKAAASRAPKAVKPGRYTVILEPAAASDLMHPMCVRGLGGQSYNEGQSFACGRLGKRVLSPLINIVDDPNGAAPGPVFDFAGQPKKPLTLVEKGVLKDIAHDTRTARKAGAEPNGHAVPFGSWLGPVPMNVAMLPGSSSLEEMIRTTERGLLVTQFHYTNMLKPSALEMTGMTRNGTFLVEGGRVRHAVKNLRFTQGIAEAFASADAVGSEAEACVAWGAVSCPAVRVRDFNFTSSTEF